MCPDAAGAGAASGTGAGRMRIVQDDLSGPEVASLLRFHLDGMQASSPPQSVHALDLEALRAPEITFWTAWDGPALMGCGALKQLDPAHGEVKSMRTDPAHLRRGVAAALLQTILGEARARGYRRVSLETGSGPEFEPAQRLYAGFGFVPCGAFGDYPADDPFSRFFTLDL